MKEFVLAMLVSMGLDGMPIKVQVTELEQPPGKQLFGLTTCSVTRTGDELDAKCVVTVDRDRWADREREWGQWAYRRNQNTLVHELCHARVFFDALEKVVDPNDLSVLHYDDHGKEFLRCARKYKVNYKRGAY